MQQASTQYSSGLRHQVSLAGLTCYTPAAQRNHFDQCRLASAGTERYRKMRRLPDLLRWGLIPYGAKDASTGPRCINPMTETVATKPPFRANSVAIVGV